MSSRAPVSSRLDLFSSRGSVLPRATASVVRSVINDIDLTPYFCTKSCLCVNARQAVVQHKSVFLSEVNFSRIPVCRE